MEAIDEERRRRRGEGEEKKKRARRDSEGTPDLRLIESLSGIGLFIALRAYSMNYVSLSHSFFRASDC